MRIGELANRTGVTTKTIRYYESVGLLAEPERTPAGYRDYSPAAVDRLRFVRDAQATGLSLTEISSIVELRRRGRSTCAHVIELLEQHLDDLDEQIEALRGARRQLAELTERARALDPTECSDPDRCQTIAATTTKRRQRHGRASRRHEQPRRHEHRA